MNTNKKIINIILTAILLTPVSALCIKGGGENHNTGGRSIGSGQNFGARPRNIDRGQAGYVVGSTTSSGTVYQDTGSGYDDSSYNNSSYDDTVYVNQPAAYGVGTRGNLPVNVNRPSGNRQNIGRSLKK